MNEKEFEAFILSHIARLQDKLKRHTPGASQRARAIVMEDTVSRAQVLGTGTLEGLESVLVETIADHHYAGTFVRLRSRHRCMCYLDRRVDCWQAHNPKTADHVPSFDWGGF